MARQTIDRSAISEAAYVLADTKGLAAVSIRSVAEACGVSVGSIYNYFPTKDDLIVEIIGTFWRNAFRDDVCQLVPGEHFDMFVDRLYETMTHALADFRSDWLPQIGALSMQGRDEGKVREHQIFDHIRRGMRAVLESDHAADPMRLAGVSSSELVGFVLDSMLSSLMNGAPDCKVLTSLLRASLYENTA